jgi:hypothetical protein
VRHSLILAFLSTLLAGQIVHAQGKFGGYMFGDYFYNVARDTAFRRANLPNAAVNGQKDLQAFQIRRIYFTYDNDISENFATRFRLESDLTAGSKETDANNKVTVFVKDAFLTWKNIFEGSNLIFGLQPTSAFDISEAAWGYRSLEKTIMDLRGVIPSRELGVSLKGKLIESGAINYWATIANNTGTSNPNGVVADVDKFKRYSVNLQFKPTDQFQITAYGSYLARPNTNLAGSTTVPPASVTNGTLTTALFAGYAEKDKYSIGVEGFLASTANGMTNSSVTPSTMKAANAMGISVFGWANVSTDLAIVGRYDYFDPNTDGNVKGDLRNYFLAGLSYKPDKNVAITPNVQIETYQAVPNGRSIDASVTGRLTFYYVFLDSK